MLRHRGVHVLLGDDENTGMTIIDPRRQVLVETRRTGQNYPTHPQDLIHTREGEGWTFHVVLDAAGSGRWVASFQHVPPVPKPRMRRTILDPDAVVDTAGTGSDAALELRLRSIERPWHEHDLPHVANVVHAELHGCVAIDVQGHRIPTGCYLELGAAAAHSGRLVRHAATVNGFDLGFDPDRRISPDADWDM